MVGKFLITGETKQELFLTIDAVYRYTERLKIY